MKKIIFLILLLVSCFLSYAQYPVFQNIGAPKTLVTSKGGFSADSALILPVFNDTNAANLSPYVKYYAGNMIRAGNQVFVRSGDATRWLIFAQSGAVPGSVTSVSQGYGIANTPNPIIGSGTIRVDTATLSSKYLRIVDTTNKWVNTITRVPGKDSIIFYVGSTRYAIKDSSGGGGTTTTAVDTIYRTPGKDSIIFTINGRRRAIKDSIGGGASGVSRIIAGSNVTISSTGANGTGNVTINSTGGGSASFSQNIIMNGTSSNRLGNYVNGDTIPVAGLGLDSAFKIIAQRAIPPTYIPPTTTISASPTANNYEIGSTLNLTFSSTFTQNDAGSLTATTYYKNNTTALASNTDNIASLTSTTQYKVTKTYNQGPCKLNNLGVLDCTGRINAGSVTSSNINFTPLPKRYWGYTSSGTPNSSQIITVNGGGDEFAYGKDKYSFSVIVTGTNQYVYYAYPTSFGILSSIIISGLESIGAFNLTTVAVTNAQGYTQNYYVYTSQNQFNNTTISFNSVN